MDQTHATLNGLEFVFDNATGTLVRLSHPATGDIIATAPDDAGLIDLAYPIPEFEPLRRSSRYSSAARIETGTDYISVRYADLGLSRDFKFEGGVEAEVVFRAAADGRTVEATCAVTNSSPQPVRQVVFPDLDGIVPFAGQGTQFRSTGFVVAPFEMLKFRQHNAPFFAHGPFHWGLGTVEYVTGGWGLQQMLTCWMDLGSLSGGLSLFHRRWGWHRYEQRPSVFLQLSERTGLLRIACAHPVTIEPGERWESDPFAFTGHEGGYARGIDPYREFVHENIDRQFEVPEHVREGMGFRTLYMSLGYIHDPASDAVWRYDQLPEVARECKEHGLDEIVLWFWGPVFQMPMETHPDLGTREQFLDAIAECRRMGVNVSPFISILALANPTAARYGWEPRHGWTYHTEMLPMFNPHYASGNLCASADAADPRWQADVLETCREWITAGAPSICWDVWATGTNEEPNLQTLTTQLRALAREVDPNAVFSAESQDKLEIECDYLDYTWNWREYSDVRAFTATFPAPRLNANIDRSPRGVKLCFADNMYMNVMPSKPDGINGSAEIERYPELSAALKQCANLRRQFLDDFVEGELIGPCLLTEPCPGTHVSAYVRPQRTMMVVLNLEEPGARTLRCDLAPWMKAADQYVVETYDGDGKPVSRETISTTRWETTTEQLGPLELRVYVFQPHKDQA